MPARTEIGAIIAAEGVFVAGRHPALRRTAERLARVGELRRLYPGIYCRWQDAATPEVRVLAAARWAPNGVLTGRAAARLTFWASVGLPFVTLSSPTERGSPPGVRVTRERLDPELITEVGGCRVTVPALTALDLALDLGGEGIDRVLRLRQASLDDMAATLRITAGRSGNTARRNWLLDSRNEPWSEAEREGHRLLRVAGVTGWEGNVPVICHDELYYLDIAFRHRRLGIEIDGREVHRAENVRQFHHDRRKWTILALSGWTLLHFGADHVFGDPEFFVSSVQRAVARSERRSA